jgi:hydroxylamine reductase (hybrid-cluster protein)
MLLDARKPREQRAEAGAKVAVSAQIFTLSGVALGALLSYLVTSVNERSRYRRDVATRLQERKFDAYAEYLGDIRQMVAAANRIAASVGLHDRTTLPLSQEDGLPILAELTARRAASSERTKLLANEETVTALHDLNTAVWDLEMIARGVIPDANAETWEEAMQAYLGALNSFHRNARHELGVPGRALDRPVVSAPAQTRDSPLKPRDTEGLQEPAP